MDGRKGWIVAVTTRDTMYSKIGAITTSVTVLDEEKKLVEYANGRVSQFDTLDDIYPTQAEALMAGARKLQVEAGRLTDAAVAAADEAAKLAAAGRVEVCST